MICNWCNKEITNSPYVVKKWQSLEEEEKYHSHCFVVAHQALLNNAPKEAIDEYNRWKEQTSKDEQITTLDGHLRNRGNPNSEKVE